MKRYTNIRKCLKDSWSDVEQIPDNYLMRLLNEKIAYVNLLFIWHLIENRKKKVQTLTLAISLLLFIVLCYSTMDLASYCNDGYCCSFLPLSCCESTNFCFYSIFISPNSTSSHFNSHHYRSKSTTENFSSWYTSITTYNLHVFHVYFRMGSYFYTYTCRLRL
jgi:hypothetical protein